MNWWWHWAFVGALHLDHRSRSCSWAGSDCRKPALLPVRTEYQLARTIHFVADMMSSHLQSTPPSAQLLNFRLLRASVMVSITTNDSSAFHFTCPAAHLPVIKTKCKLRLLLCPLSPSTLLPLSSLAIYLPSNCKSWLAAAKATAANSCGQKLPILSVSRLWFIKQRDLIVLNKLAIHNWKWNRLRW